MASTFHAFEFAADAWDWLGDHGFFMVEDPICADSGGLLFDFLHPDGRSARLSPAAQHGANIRIFPNARTCCEPPSEKRSEPN